MKSFVVLLLATLLVGCATAPEKLGATYVSPLQYKDYTCDQIGMEMQRVSRRVAVLRGTLDEEASTDAAQMGIGLLLFWPALFFLEGGDGVQAAQYAQLKGEFEALEQVSIQKSCGIKVQPDRVSPPLGSQQRAHPHPPNLSRRAEGIGRRAAPRCAA